MVSEAHCMSFSCTELLLFNYAKVKTVFHYMTPLKQSDIAFMEKKKHTCPSR